MGAPGFRPELRNKGGTSGVAIQIETLLRDSAPIPN
jgi:hypothetical protein